MSKHLSDPIFNKADEQDDDSIDLVVHLSYNYFSLYFATA